MIQPQDEENKGTLESLGYAESFVGHTGRKFYGRYRGKVAANVDPLGQGRLSVTVPDMLGPVPEDVGAAPVPFAGPLMGTYVCPPPVGAGVWVEFEQGNPEKPVWVGAATGTTNRCLPRQGSWPTRPPKPVPPPRL